MEIENYDPKKPSFEIKKQNKSLYKINILPSKKSMMYGVLIEIEIKIKKDYPNSLPFVRILTEINHPCVLLESKTLFLNFPPNNLVENKLFFNEKNINPFVFLISRLFECSPLFFENSHRNDFRLIDFLESKKLFSVFWNPHRHNYFPFSAKLEIKNVITLFHLLKKEKMSFSSHWIHFVPRNIVYLIASFVVLNCFEIKYEIEKI